jgi:hypothetical protein
MDNGQYLTVVLTVCIALLFFHFFKIQIKNRHTKRQKEPRKTIEETSGWVAGTGQQVAQPHDDNDDDDDD